MTPDLSPRASLILFAIVIVAWGGNWSVTQVIVESVPPLWTTAFRCWIAVAALLPTLWLSGNLVPPPREDAPVVLSISLLHMVAFSTLAAAGQQFVPASKAIVLGYTTPVWVAVAAPYFLGERLTRWTAAGVAVSLCGLLLIFQPGSFNWTDRSTVLGCGLIMLASACWAANIVFVRSHRWVATPFQLLFWQALVAAIVLSILAWLFEGRPSFVWTYELTLLFMYGGLIGTVLAYWAMSVVNQRLPAIATSLGVLATPLVGIACARFTLGEQVDVSLVIAAALIVGGVALGILGNAQYNRRWKKL